MASIFKPPYISSVQLSSLMVEDGQLVFNTDDKQFYTGNGTLGGRNIATTIPVPSKTSDLINDSGFITADDASIPSKTSDLINDSGFITADDIPEISYTQTDPIYLSDKPNIAFKSDLFSKSYNDLTDKPDIFVPKTTGAGIQFLSDDGTYKEISNQNQSYYLNIRHITADSMMQQDILAINLNVYKDDAIIYNDTIIDNGKKCQLIFNSIDLTGFELDKVKTIQLWIPVKNAISSTEDLQATTSISIIDDIEIVDSDSFTLSLKRKQYVENQQSTRVYVYVMRFIPLIDGNVKKTINYSHHFDVDYTIK